MKNILAGGKSFLNYNISKYNAFKYNNIVKNSKYFYIDFNYRKVNRNFDKKQFCSIDNNNKETSSSGQEESQKSEIKINCINFYKI
jgi:hypothetical protein